MPMRWNSQNKFFSTSLRVAFPASKIADFLVSRAKQARKVYTRNRKVFFLFRGEKTRVNIFRLLFRVWRCLSCSRKLVRGSENTITGRHQRSFTEQIDRIELWLHFSSHTVADLFSHPRTLRKQMTFQLFMSHNGVKTFNYVSTMEIWHWVDFSCTRYKTFKAIFTLQINFHVKNW
jgi:hypothetical protein